LSSTVVDAYWDFPEQLADISYGSVGDVLIASGADARVLVPEDGSLGTSWTEPGFTPGAAWLEGPTAVGYDVGTGSGPSTPLRVDFGRSIDAGPTQPGWESLEHDGTSAATGSFLHAELAGPGGSVDVTLSGQTHWRDYAPANGDFAPLSDLLSDGPLANAPAVLTLTLENLVDGTYEITTYHHTTQFGPNDRPPPTPFDIYVTDGQRTGAPLVVGAVMSDNDSPALRTETFQFAVIDSSPVQVAFDRGPSVGEADHFALPGFELVLLAEARVGVVTDTRFSVDRGFFSAPFPLEITTDTPDAEIRYTTDGSPPTETTGTVYTGPITIDGLTTLRAAAFKPGCLPTNVDTHTYLFLDDVVVQDGAGLPTGWGIGADYAMDDDPADLARIAGDPAYTLEQSRQAQLSLVR
jgi:hypothetical protein